MQTGKNHSSVKIDKDVLKKAYAVGLNVNRVCENALAEMINRLLGMNTQTNFRNRQNGFGHNRFLARSEGFEPSRPFLTTDLAGLPPTRLADLRCNAN